METKAGYGIVANLPNAPHPFTYQLKPRAVEFYGQLGYADGDGIDGRLVWPLRRLGDLYIIGENRASDDETNELPVLGNLDKFSFTDHEKQALAQYVRAHPRSTEAIRSDLNDRLFGEGFDFSAESSGMHGEWNRKDGNEDDFSLPDDVVGHIDGWVNWDWIKEKLCNSSNRNEFLNDVKKIPGNVKSVRDFADHPSSVHTFSYPRNAPSYRFLLEQNTLSDWVCTDLRFVDSKADFSVEFWLEHTPIEESYGTIYMGFDIIDGYTTNWEVHSDYLCKIEIESLSPVEWHSIVHYQSEALNVIEEFFEEFTEYELSTPSSL